MIQLVSSVKQLLLPKILTFSFMILSASRKTLAVAGESETSSGAGSWAGRRTMNFASPLLTKSGFPPAKGSVQMVSFESDDGGEEIQSKEQEEEDSPLLMIDENNVA